MKVTEFKIASNLLRAGADGTIPSIVEGSIEKARLPRVIILQNRGFHYDGMVHPGRNNIEKYRSLHEM